MVCSRQGNKLWLVICSLVTCLYLASAGRYVEQNTTDLTRYVLNDLGVEVTRKNYLVFDLMACEDAFIHLDETQTSGNYYQIVLGASGNSWFGLRNRSDNAYPSVFGWGEFLNCSRYVTFWMTWNDCGDVKIGEGSDIGDKLILEYNDGDAGFEIHYLSISSYYDQTAAWRLLIDDSPVVTVPSPNGNTTIYVPENTSPGDTIFTLMAWDPEDDVISFDVIGEHCDVFKCVGNELKTNAVLDFETIQLYRVCIRANDSRNVVDVCLTVMVTDKIDEIPDITLSHVTTVQEEMSVGAVVGPFFKVTDADYQDPLTYSLSGADNDYFSINSSTGEMLMNTRLNRDGGTGKTDLHLDLIVTDSAGLISSVKVTLSVVDVNDNAPQFSQSIYYMNISENSLRDYLLGELTCADEDSGDNSNISLSIVNGDDAGSPKFSIRGLELFGDGVSIDYESNPAHEYTLTVQATDNPGGGWQNSATTIVVIKVLPENEFIPVWVTPVTNSSGHFPSHVIPENTTIGSRVLSFLAADQDGGVDGIVEYHLTSVVTVDGQDASHVFSIDPSSGHLATVQTLDRDLTLGGVEYYDIVVKATDLNTVPKYVEGRIRVFLSNVNDNAPRFNQSLYRCQITCDLDLVNQTFDLKVIDDDGDNVFSFYVESNIYISVNQSTGRLSVLSRPTGSDSVLLMVSVTDRDRPVLTGECHVFVQFLPCINDSSATTYSTTTTSTPATERQTSAATFDVDVERWALRTACAILTAILIIIALTYTIKSKLFSKLAMETSVSSQRINRDSGVIRGLQPVRRPRQFRGPRLDRHTQPNTVSPEPPRLSVSPTWSSASGSSSPSWSSAGSVSEGSTQMTSLPSIESLHLV